MYQEGEPTPSEDDWLQRISILLNEYDGILSNTNLDHILEKHRQPPDKEFIVESAWIPYNEELNKIQTDQLESTPERIGLEYRHHLQMKQLRANRLGMTAEPFLPIPGLTEGNDWTLNETTGHWSVPSMDLPDDPIEPDIDYDATFQTDDITVQKCQQPHTTDTKAITDHRIQSDTGANANITPDLSLLEDIQWIEPVQCKSAKRDAQIEVQAIGKYTIRGTPLRINMYFCPEADNTIISPTAIVRQNANQFVGYQKLLRLDKNSGHIRLIPREGHSEIQIPIYTDNDLCYHRHTHTFIEPEKWGGAPTCPTINRLSDAAKWELWHQRLVHPGTRVMEQQHQCSDGVPPLRGNAFWRCPSCMSGKLITKQSGKHKNIGTTNATNRKQSNTLKPTRSPSTSEDIEDDDDDADFLDEIHLPDALPGQHFHIDFGFVRGSEFRVPTENGQGPTLTSVDGKNSYCLIVDRATRFL